MSDAKLVWVNTPGYSEQNVAGRPLHAVREGENHSACGIKRALWGFDLFNTDRCKRCQRALSRSKNGPRRK